jgi:phage head maturation protease
MGDYDKLNKLVEEGEKRILREMNAKEDFLEEYFKNKARQELNNKKISQMSWDEVNLLNDLRKDDADKNYLGHHVDNATLIKPEDQIKKIEQYIEACKRKAMSNGRRDLLPDFEILSKLINQHKSMNQKKTQPLEPEFEIEDEPNDDNIAKSFETVKISKSGENMTIEGFVSSDIIDRQGHKINMKVLEKSLPQYLDHGIIMLNHKNRPVARIYNYHFMKTDSGSNGLYIRAKMFEGCEDVANEIGKSLHGFSIAGIATLREKCDKAKCFKDIIDLKLHEISLVNNPACPEAKVGMS